MSKVAKILILITSISLGLVIYLIISSKLVVMENETVDNSLAGQSVVEEKAVDLGLLAKEYRNEIKKIVEDLDGLIIDLTATSSKLSEESGTSSETLVPESEIKASMLKKRAMDLIVPAEYRDLHIKIVLAISRLDDYSQTRIVTDLEEGIKLASEIKTENIWTE